MSPIIIAGTYNVVVQDGAGCVTSPTSVIITEPPVLSLSTSQTTADCYGGSNATATAIVSGGTSPFTYLWNTSPPQSTSTASNLSPANYSVSVTDNNNCSLTAGITIVSSMPDIPICLVTVDSTSTKNLIIWEKPVTSAIDSFKIYREIGLNNYVLIGSVLYSALSEFTDTTNGVNPKITAYRYKISVLDTCGNESPFSNHHRTIHLSTPDFTPPQTFDLIWTNDYEGFSFSQYFILRDGNGTGNWVKIDSVTFGNLSYTDLNAPSPNANYIVEAAHPTGCDATLKVKKYNASKSNTASTVITANSEMQEENDGVVIVPNPNSGEFQILSFRFQILSLEIYNVLGEKIFQSDISNQKPEISIPVISPGIYHIKLKTNKGVVYKKLVIR